MQTAAVPIELGLTYLRCQSVGGSLEVVSLALDFAPIHQLMCFPSAMRDSVQSHCQFRAIDTERERRLKYLDSFRNVE